MGSLPDEDNTRQDDDDGGWVWEPPSYMKQIQYIEQLIAPARNIPQSLAAQLGVIREQQQQIQVVQRALGYRRVYRRSPRRAGNKSVYVPPQKMRGVGRPSVRTKSRDEVYQTLHEHLNRFGQQPALARLAKTLGLGRTTILDYINDPRYFGSRDAFDRYCSDYIKQLHP